MKILKNIKKASFEKAFPEFKKKNQIFEKKKHLNIYYFFIFIKKKIFSFSLMETEKIPIEISYDSICKKFLWNSSNKIDSLITFLKKKFVINKKFCSIFFKGQLLDPEKILMIMELRVVIKKWS